MHRQLAHHTQQRQSRLDTTHASLTASRQGFPFKLLAQLAVVGIAGITLIPACTGTSDGDPAAPPPESASAPMAIPTPDATSTTTSAVSITAPILTTDVVTTMQPTQPAATTAVSQPMTETKATSSRATTAPVTVQVQCATKTLTINFVPTPSQLDEICRPYTPLPPTTPTTQTPAATTTMPPVSTTTLPPLTTTTRPPISSQPPTTAPQEPRPVSNNLADAGCDNCTSLLRWTVTYSNGDRRTGVARFTVDETKVFVPEPAYLGTVQIVFFAGKSSCTYSTVMIVGW